MLPIVIAWCIFVYVCVGVCAASQPKLTKLAELAKLAQYTHTDGLRESFN